MTAVELFNKIKNEITIWIDDDGLFTNEMIRPFEWENTLGNLSVESGASKLAFVPFTENFVLKVPFSGFEDCFYEWAGSGILPDEECGWDYCYVESYVYEKAKEAGLEAFFAKTSFVGELYDMLPVYAQVKCTSSNSTYLDEQPSRHSLEIAEEISEKSHGEDIFHDLEWIASAIDYYGVDKVKSLMNFIDVICLNDLHSGNYGYTLENKRPVIFDYSGFND